MKSRVYIKIDEQKRVTQIEGECSLANLGDLSEAILVEEGEPCDRLNHAQNAYLEKPLRDDRGLLRYKWDGKKIVERTQTEIDTDYVEPVEEVSQIDRIEAQVFYTAMLTDSLIESEEEE